jgi:hypothetical protein
MNIFLRIFLSILIGIITVIVFSIIRLVLTQIVGVESIWWAVVLWILRDSVVFIVGVIISFIKLKGKQKS